jgi:hypothetical protein
MYEQKYTQRHPRKRWGVFEEVGLSKRRQVDYAYSPETARTIAQMMGANDDNRYFVERL